MAEISLPLSNQIFVLTEISVPLSNETCNLFQQYLTDVGMGINGPYMLFPVLNSCISWSGGSSLLELNIELRHWIGERWLFCTRNYLQPVSIIIP
jgi:hypothetical protein